MVLAAAKRTSLKPFIFARVVLGSAVGPVLRAPLNAQRSLLKVEEQPIFGIAAAVALHAVIPAGSETKTPSPLLKSSPIDGPHA